MQSCTRASACSAAPRPRPSPAATARLPARSAQRASRRTPPRRPLAWVARGACCAAAAGSNEPPQGQVTAADAVINAAGIVSKVAGKDVTLLGRNLVLGSDDSDDSWRALDQKVNTYPFEREFKAIGTGGEDFVLSMMAAATSVTGEQLQRDKVVVRESRTAKYLAVNVYVRVESGEQVIAIFQAMKADTRLRYFL